MAEMDRVKSSHLLDPNAFYRDADDGRVFPVRLVRLDESCDPPEARLVYFRGPDDVVVTGWKERGINAFGCWWPIDEPESSP